MRDVLQGLVMLVSWIAAFVASWFVFSALFFFLVNVVASELHRIRVLGGPWGFEHVFLLPSVVALVASLVMATYIAYQARRLVPPRESDLQSELQE
jgi:hypothetical protein